MRAPHRRHVGTLTNAVSPSPSTPGEPHVLSPAAEPSPGHRRWGGGGFALWGGGRPPVLPPSPGVLCHRACKAWCFATLHLSPPRPQQGASGVLSTQVTRGHRQRPPAADVGCTRAIWGAAACAPETFTWARRPWPLPRGIREGPVCGLCLPWRPLMKVARRPVWVWSSVKAGGGRWGAAIRPRAPQAPWRTPCGLAHVACHAAPR